MPPIRREKLVFVLGAGASRDVTTPGSYPSFIDSDFYDMLVRESAKRGARGYLRDTVTLAKKAPINQPWHSMETLFYSLYMQLALKQNICRERGRRADVGKFTKDFTRSIMFLLQHALGAKRPMQHAELLTALKPGDSIITFNYDFMVERALLEIDPQLEIDRRIYGFGTQPRHREGRLTIHKLHGSLNWNCVGDLRQPDEIEVAGWPRKLYMSARSYVPQKGLTPAILLPYWDKPVEDGLWAAVWRGAAQDIRRAKNLLVWGYSMPTTDIKSTELFRQALASRQHDVRNLAVIDPNPEVHSRWRALLPNAVYWRYDRMMYLDGRLPPWLPIRQIFIEKDRLVPGGRRSMH